MIKKAISCYIIMICGGKKIKDFSGTNPGPSHDLQGHWTIKFTITQLYSKKKK